MVQKLVHQTFFVFTRALGEQLNANISVGGGWDGGYSEQLNAKYTSRGWGVQ